MSLIVAKWRRCWSAQTLFWETECHLCWTGLYFKTQDCSMVVLFGSSAALENLSWGSAQMHLLPVQSWYTSCILSWVGRKLDTITLDYCNVPCMDLRLKRTWKLQWLLAGLL